MGLLQKLKSVLGLDGTGSSESGRSGDVDVTVEREPATEDEDAVKGTETAGSGEPGASETDPTESAGAESEAPSAEEFETLAEETEADDTAGSPDPVTELNGIGPAYGDRLAGAGVETVGELARADAADLADRIDLGESRVAGWIEQASDY